MSRTKKADHRRVQPGPEHYLERNGTKYLIGPYSFEQRTKYIKLQTELQLVRHPQQKPADAKKAAFHKWRNVVIATI